MTDTVDRWVSVEEICKYLGAGKDTVYKWIDKNGVCLHIAWVDHGSLKRLK